MDNFKSVEVTKNFTIAVVDGIQTYDEKTSKEIDALWESEKEKKGAKLFDGILLNIIKIQTEGLVVQRIRYRTYIAQRLAPHLKERLKVRPLTTCGITLCERQVLIGRRASFVTTYPDHYEFAPSGGVDEAAIVGNRVDIARQIVEELKEETGLRPSYVIDVIPSLLIKNEDEGTMEICCIVNLHRDALTFDEFPKDEYDDLFWLSKEQALEHLHQHHEDYIPASRFFFEKLWMMLG